MNRHHNGMNNSNKATVIYLVIQVLEERALKTRGRATQSLGATVWKARSPFVFSLIRVQPGPPSGWTSGTGWEHRAGEGQSRWGQDPCRALNMITRALNWYLKATGRQCRQCRMRVMWQDFRDRVNSLRRPGWSTDDLLRKVKSEL